MMTLSQQLTPLGLRRAGLARLAIALVGIGVC